MLIADPDFDMTGIGNATIPEKTTNGARRSITRLDRVQRLPGTAYEAKAVLPSLERYTQSKAQLFLDREATELRYKSVLSPRVLLLGTHGYFFDKQEVRVKGDPYFTLADQTETVTALTRDGELIENPLLRCGLLFAGCNAEDAPGADDGVLTGLEIVDTDLRGTELVVLSACDTGIGDVRNGEGVAGLRQAFQLAGALSVVATLWKIPDDETSQFMNDFFGYLADGASKSDALRLAQINRIAEQREKAEPPQSTGPHSH